MESDHLTGIILVGLFLLFFLSIVDNYHTSSEECEDLCGERGVESYSGCTPNHEGDACVCGDSR